MQVEIWTDINCPFCYLGLNSFGKALDAFAQRERIEVVHRSYELDPAQPRGASESVIAHLAEKYELDLDQAAEGERKLAEKALADGLPYVVADRDFGNTFDMHRLVHFAAESGRAQQMLDAFFAANFADARPLFGDPERTVEVAAGAGFDEAAVREVLADEDRYAIDVRDDEELAVNFKIPGVPFFVLDRHYVINGYEPAETIGEALQLAWDRFTGAASN